MQQVVLPFNAQIIHDSKLFVADLVVGDRITGYDLQRKMLVTATLTAVTPLEPVAKRIVNCHQQPHPICFAEETVVLTPQGNKTLGSRPRSFMGFCRHNSKVVTLRQVLTVVEFGDTTVPAFLLQWESPAYIWSEGVLVGSAAE